MLTLRSAAPSPYGRKVKIAAALMGLTDKINVVVADTTDPGEVLRQQNPLGKIPTLVLEDGTTLFDSRVIVEYLDMLAGGGKVLPRGLKRIPVLRLQALADGLLDAALIIIYEGRWREESMRNASWTAHQQGKIDRVLGVWEANPPKIPTKIDVGVITVACALGYLDLRFAGTWRKKHPKMVRWLKKFDTKVPSFEATRVKP
jgi:glutathione S-transferase